MRTLFGGLSGRAQACALALGASIGAIAVGVGCGGANAGNGFDTTDAGGANDSGTITGGDGGGLVEGDGGGTTGTTLFYAHTDTTLYSLDPTNVSATPTKIGDFDCITGSGDSKSMTDIGVAKDGSLYGVSQGAAYPLTISGSNVHCAATWPLPNSSKNSFYGLTVAPENTVAAAEVLIAADSSGKLWQIDANTGATTQVGTFGSDPANGRTWGLSGDIVFMANGGSPIGFATVRTCPSGGGSCDTTDTLIQIDVSQVHAGTQVVTKSVQGPVNKGSWCTNAASPASFGSMYGIAAFQDKVYGFSREGDVVEIHNTDGSGCLVNAYSSMKFAGAGVTTSAPVIAPR